MVFGGRSEIGTELAKRLAPEARVILAARGTHGLDEASQALRAAGAAAVYTKEFNADDLAAHGPVLEEITTDYGCSRSIRSAARATPASTAASTPTCC